MRLSSSSGALSRPCRNFGAVARATTFTHNPWSSDLDDFWLRPAPRQLSDTPFDLASPFQISSHAPRLMSEALTSRFVTRHPRFSSAQDRASSPTTKVNFAVKEGDSSITLSAAVPGHTKADIKVKMTADKVLVISGQHNFNNETSMDGHTHIRHISSSFIRRYQLPSNTDTDGISAKLENGMLTLHVSKTVTPEMPDKEIPIHSSPAQAATAASIPAADNVVRGQSEGHAASSHINTASGTDKEQNGPAITA
ncbi:hypothetical protein WJX77_002425 [Trebouxia sp. C0004]